MRRVVYASLVQAIGYKINEDRIDANALDRPDRPYGLSKCFANGLGRHYWDKFGIKTMALRIYSSFPEPADLQMLWSWLSDDCIRLVAASLTAPRVGFTLALGISNNGLKAVNNRISGHLGWRRQTISETFRARVEESTPVPNSWAQAVMHLGVGGPPP